MSEQLKLKMTLRKESLNIDFGTEGNEFSHAYKFEPRNLGDIGVAGFCIRLCPALHTEVIKALDNSHLYDLELTFTPKK